MECESSPLVRPFASPGVMREGVSQDKSAHVTDEVFNSGSALVGFLLSILGAALLCTHSALSGDPWYIVGCAIYSLSLMMMFLSSAMHHLLVSLHPRVERALRLFDYCSIFPLIAGTMTPFALACGHGDWWAWCIFGTSWLICFAGIALLCVYGLDAVPKWLSTLIFVVMGWLAGMLIPFVRSCTGDAAIILVAIGGVLYTVGGAVFLLEKPNPLPGVFGFHEIWHSFVLIAAATHWAAIYAIEF